MHRYWVSFFEGGGKAEIVTAVSRTNAKEVAERLFPGREIREMGQLRSPLRSTKPRGERRRDGVELVYKTPNVGLTEPERDALWRIQALTGESVVGTIRRLIAEADPERHSPKE